MSEWISFFDKLPTHGQKIWYYGEHIGIWLGHYEYRPDDPVSTHLMFSEGGVVDRMDAPWWIPASELKPRKPAEEYPRDYPVDA